MLKMQFVITMFLVVPLWIRAIKQPLINKDQIFVTSELLISPDFLIGDKLQDGALYGCLFEFKLVNFLFTVISY